MRAQPTTAMRLHVRRIVGLSTPEGRGRTLAYWLATLAVATECVVGGLMGGLRWQPFLGIMGHLGYPPYLMSLIGAWYLLAGLALHAVVSHLAVGDGARALVGPIVLAGSTSISWALRPSARRDLSPPRAAGTATIERGGQHRIRTIAYWTFTLMVAFEMVAGSMWDLLEIDYVRAVLTHLGYPLYLLLILGVWKLPCAVVLLVPRFPRLKEWAYAGAFFNYSGAVFSHVSAGDGANRWAWPLVFAVLTLASWALRPPERRDVLERPPGSARPAAWAVPLGLVAAFLVLSLLTLPKGPPPP